MCPVAAVRRLFGGQSERLFDEREIEISRNEP